METITKKIKALIQNHIQIYWKPLAMFYLLTSLFLLYIGMQDKVPTETLTRDIISVVDMPFYTGIVSQIGFIFWSTAAAACLLAFVATSKTKTDCWTRYFCLYSAILTILLMLDDMLLVHEQIVPMLFSVPESITKILYMVLVFIMIVVFYRVIANSVFIIFGLALSFFFISIALDSIPPLPIIWHFQSIMFEDSAKFLGIVSWCIYYCIFFFETIRETQSI